MRIITQGYGIGTTPGEQIITGGLDAPMSPITETFSRISEVSFIFSDIGNLNLIFSAHSEITQIFSGTSELYILED